NQSIPKWRNSFAHIKILTCFNSFKDQIDVVVYGLFFFGEISNHLFFKVFNTFYKIVLFFSNDYSVVNIPHIGPLQFTITYVIEQFFYHAVFSLDFTYIMYAHIPFIAFTFKNMCKTAGGIMSF